ncbi:MAG: sugar phosphate isomerase/epimerase [Clostridia bacterium]|nr:sugar phosphate isomerase/epimerase [Clostridia bacterium]
MKIGLQVYTVRDAADKDFKGTMEKIKEMGYDGVELAGLCGKTIAEVAAIMKEVGLLVESAHVPYQELIVDPVNTIAAYKSLGCKYITIPYMVDEHRPGNPGFNEVVANIAKIGEECKKQGVTLLYHNHDFEFVRVENGQYGLDYLYSEVPADLLQTELDTCWVNVAGENPTEYIKKYAGRCPVVHLKDFVGGKSENMYELIGTDTAKAETKEEFAFRPVGQGVQDFKSITAAAVECGAEWMIVEQDNTYEIPSVEAAKMSREYLKSIGF